MERRLSDLEARASRTDPRQQSPIEVRVLLKAVARHKARERGEDPPPAYTPEELEEMYAEDLDTVAGAGVVGELRASGGWEENGREMLNAWEEGARRRLERVEDGEPLEVVYEHDEDEEIHEFDE